MLRNPRRVWALAWLLSTLVGATALAQPGSPSPDDATATTWTLEEALARARRESPALRRAAALLQAARADLVEARTYPHNPEIGIEGAERSAAGESSTDRGLELGQEIEIRGQRGKRIRAAESALEAAENRYSRRTREVLAAVERAFASTLRNRELRDVARQDVELTRSLLSFEERRLETGAGTQIALNLARAAAGRAVRRLQAATAAWKTSRATLAETIGYDPAQPIRVSGELPSDPGSVPALEDLTRMALERRADLAAARQEVERARRRIELERSQASPDLGLGVFSAREEGSDIVGVRVSIGLPLFDRNQGGIANAEAARGRVEAESRSAELAASREVTTAYERYRAAAESVTALQDLVIDNLEESLGLLRQAVEAGELSATEVLLSRRELVEGRREQIEAAGELWTARIDLELAVGGPILPTVQEETNP